MRDPIKKTIDGKCYTFCSLRFKKSRSVALKIANIIAPTVAEGTTGNPANLLDKKIDPSTAIKILFERIEEDSVNYIFDSLLEDCLCDGKRIGHPDEMNSLHDALFSGQMVHYVKVVIAAFQAEYSSFFDEKGVLKSI